LRILQISARLPWPLTDGGAIGIFHLARAAHEEGHDVTFLSFPLDDVSLTKEAVAEMSKFCDVRLVSKPLPSRAKTLLRTVFRGAYPIERRMMPEMYELISKTIAEKQFDVVHLDHSHVGKYGRWIKSRYKLPVVLRQHNFETVIYERFAATETNWVKRLIGSIHGKRLRNEERSILNEVDAVAAITEQDVALMRVEAPNAHYHVIPAGVDTSYFVPTDPGIVKPNTVLWVGGIEWEPNRDALDYFLRSIFPEIKEHEPLIQLEIIGSGTAIFTKLASPFGEAVRIHGKVPDIRKYLAEAGVLVVPLRVGGGMRVKLLEFFAAGKAIVSTSIGAEGNLARNGVEIELRDNSQEFAKAVVELLRDPLRSQALGSAARALAEKEYGWPSVAEKFTHVYKSVINLS
jgi:glycosyltransferase involved in cell wall biosynthesis